ncbi:hypothetical protein [Luethyella okanaganae]|uniref:Uncharacterized protein n=1 Tax=Luethyella okanaganae TaxID=69372 RepID=A0ABW1VGF0_9MICO
MTIKTVRKLLGAAGTVVMASLVLVAGATVPANASGESHITIEEFGHIGVGKSVSVSGTLRLNGKYYDGGSSDPVIDEHGDFTRAYPTVDLPTGDWEYQMSLVDWSDTSFVAPSLGCRVVEDSGKELAREEKRDTRSVTCSFTIGK